MGSLDIKDNNYFQVSGFMVNKLNLKGIPLMVYAIIYGFSQDGESCFNGSRKYLCDFTGTTKPTIDKALNELVESNLIIKNSEKRNNVLFNTYKANLNVVDFTTGKETLPPSKETLPPSKETLLGGSKETLPNNNILYNNENNIIENSNIEKQNKESISKDIKENKGKGQSLDNSKTKSYITFGEYGRIKLTKEEYIKLCSEYGKPFIDNEIKLLDEYVESNNNKNKYKNYNLVLRKAIRDNWFKHNNYQFSQQPEPQRYKGLDIDRDKVIDTHPEFDLDDLPY